MKPRDWAKGTWEIGFPLFLIGVFWAAFDRKQGNSFSEGFARLPGPARDFSLIAIGTVLGHWCWPMPAPEVNIENMTVESD